MKGLAKILSMLLLSAGIIPVTANARPGGGNEAFEKLKVLVGHWETDKSSMNKASLDLELTSGGPAVLQKIHMGENRQPAGMATLYYLDGAQGKTTHYWMPC